MKRLLSGLLILAVIMIAAFGGVANVSAGTYEEESDLAFFKVLEKMLVDEEVTQQSIEIIKEPLYDLALDQLGYVYSIGITGSEGFALVINTDGIFDVAEIYLNAVNPYDGHDGQKVYVHLFLYLMYENDNFVESKTNLILDADTINTLSEKAFYTSGSVLYFEQEIVYYTNRVPNDYNLAYRHPAYFPVEITNGCTPAAGGNIIGYFTRFYPELIPGFVPGNSLLSLYLYVEMANEVTPVIKTLYNYMGTNTDEPGTTIVGFRNGMTRYCNEKGKNISFSSCMQNGTFNFNLAKQKFAEGLPVVLFVDTFTAATISNTSGRDTLTYLVGKACHAMAGFGYSEITYTLTNGQTRIDRYIAVATGILDSTKGYYNINYQTQIDEVYAINIY